MNTQPVPVRNAATVMLLRDSQEGLQTFLLRRNRRTAFGPGMYVFPGGALDDDDARAELLSRCDGIEEADAREILGGADQGLALWIAAVRECFEEAGVLIASDAAGRQPVITPGLEEARVRLNAGEMNFARICQQFDLRLPVWRLCYFSHWITPRGAPRRFSTRFFACRVEAGQQAVHDGSETVAGEWITPADAVARYEAGGMPMMPPTIVQMRFLKAYETSEAVMRELESMTSVRVRGAV